VRIRLSSFLPRTRSKVVFVFVISCYSIVLSQFVRTLLRAGNTPPPPREFYSGLQHPVLHVFELLLVAPVIESFILIGIFELVRRAHAPSAIQVFAAAWVVSALHAVPWAPHAIIVLPAFCLYAASYLYWRHAGWRMAFTIVLFIHMMDNLMSAISTLAYAVRHA
jgi:hypothetical protein